MREITPETVCYRVFLCSWTGESSPASYKGKLEPRSSMTRFAETPATAYLTQWVMVGSTPHLVMYDGRSNTHMIRGEIAETQELQVLSGRAGRIYATGGGYMSTGFGSYKARLGPSRSGKQLELNCQGLQEITGPLVKHLLQEIHKELRDAGVIGFNAPLPEYTGEGTSEHTGGTTGCQS